MSDTDDRSTEWVTLRSSLTPAAAAGLVTFIVNALYQSLGVPKAECGLVLSFLISAVLLLQPMRLLARLVLWPINALLIFAVFVGANSVGSKVTDAGAQVLGQAEPAPVMSFTWTIGTVGATSAVGTPAPSRTPSLASGEGGTPPPLRFEIGSLEGPAIYEWRVLDHRSADVAGLPLSEVADRDVTVVVRARGRQFFDPVF